MSAISVKDFQEIKGELELSRDLLTKRITIIDNTLKKAKSLFESKVEPSVKSTSSKISLADAQKLKTKQEIVDALHKLGIDEKSVHRADGKKNLEPRVVDLKAALISKISENIIKKFATTEEQKEGIKERSDAVIEEEITSQSTKKLIETEEKEKEKITKEIKVVVDLEKGYAKDNYDFIYAIPRDKPSFIILKMVKDELKVLSKKDIEFLKENNLPYEVHPLKEAKKLIAPLIKLESPVAEKVVEIKEEEIIKPEIKVKPQAETHSEVNQSTFVSFSKNIEDLDIFDFIKYKEWYDIASKYYKGLELYIRSVIFINNLLLISTEEEFKDYLHRAEQSKEFIDIETEDFDFDYIIKKWYRHVFPTDLEGADRKAITAIKNYGADKVSQNDAFNRFYKRYVDKDAQFQKLWFLGEKPEIVVQEKQPKIVIEEKKIIPESEKKYADTAAEGVEIIEKKEKKITEDVEKSKKSKVVVLNARPEGLTDFQSSRESKIQEVKEEIRQKEPELLKEEKDMWTGPTEDEFKKFVLYKNNGGSTSKPLDVADKLGMNKEKIIYIIRNYSGLCNKYKIDPEECGKAKLKINQPKK